MRQRTRIQAIDDLREKLLTLVDDEHSICEVAARLGIFCKGFAQWNFQDLKKHYDWIAHKRPANISRKEMEDLANRWQLARKTVLNTLIACDTETAECHTCKGWNEFSDDQLAQFYDELLGEKITIG
jgi:hypothetical protein